jgi:hypothetical protein
MRTTLVDPAAPSFPWGGRRLILVTALALTMTGCAAASLTESGRLTSYAALKPSDGLLTKARVFADKRSLAAAKKVALLPTQVDEKASASGLTAQQLRLVSNAIDRAVCRDLSRRFVIVAEGQPSDLVVQALITRIDKTDTLAAGASVVTGLGGKVAGAVTGIPIPLPRIPLGMGSLTVEAEARTIDKRQVAALVWARGADALTTGARVAEEADAHTLASSFAADFAKLLVTGDDPIANPTPMMPTGQGIQGDSKNRTGRRMTWGANRIL